jgi:hypothetical protein
MPRRLPAPSRAVAGAQPIAIFDRDAQGARRARRRRLGFSRCGRSSGHLLIRPATRLHYSGRPRRKSPCFAASSAAATMSSPSCGSTPARIERATRLLAPTSGCAGYVCRTVRSVRRLPSHPFRRGSDSSRSGRLLTSCGSIATCSLWRARGVAEGPSRGQLELEDSSAINPLSRHLANARPASSRRIMSPATAACATGDVLLYNLPTERSLHHRRTACNE